MRDPDLIARAQLAASALEGAWHRWRLVHGDVVDTMPAVSSYVGYSLHEPWGQPRVVFGLAAQDAEQLAALLERHGCVEPAYAAATTRPHVPDLAARTQPRDVAVPVPRRPSAAPARQAPLLAGANSGYDEPLYREVAAAMREAAGARESASRTKTESATESRQVTDLVSPAWMGSLAMAASTARAEAEARIRAALTQPAPTQPAPTQPAPTQPAGEPADSAASDTDAESQDTAGERTSDDQGGPDGSGDADVVGVESPQEADASQDESAEDDPTASRDDSRAMPQIYATDVLEPLPAPDPDARAETSDLEAPAEELGHDDQDLNLLDPDPRDPTAHGADAHGPDAHDPNAHDPAAAADLATDDHDARDRNIRNWNIRDRDADEGVSADVPKQDDHDEAVGVRSGGPASGIPRRGRGYPIARLSKTKRPGTSSNPVGD